jgi:hypothetical protein
MSNYQALRETRGTEDQPVQGHVRTEHRCAPFSEVTAPNQINLASTGLRLVKPQAKTCPRCGQPAHPGECEQRSQPGDSSTSGDGTSEEPGNTGGDGLSGGEQTQSEEKRVAFTVTRNMLVNPEDADQLAAVFRRLYIALDERNVNYLQANLQPLFTQLRRTGVLGTWCLSDSPRFTKKYSYLAHLSDACPLRKKYDAIVTWPTDRHVVGRRTATCPPPRPGPATSNHHPLPLAGREQGDASGSGT